MMHPLGTYQGLRGIYNILPTPFTQKYTIDELSLRRLLKTIVAMGIDGITILGVAGEAHKLTVQEPHHMAC